MTELGIVFVGTKMLLTVRTVSVPTRHVVAARRRRRELHDSVTVVLLLRLD